MSDERSPASEPTPVPLRCCHGQPAPIPVVVGWGQFLLLPDEVRDDFQAILERALLEPSELDPRLLDHYCQQNNLQPEAFGAALASCEYFLRQATALDLDVATLRQDFLALSGDHAPRAELLLSRYDFLRSALRRVNLVETLADHGKVLVGLDWRMDQVTNSDRGVRMDTAVVFLTLRYREGDRIDRVTLQLTPESLQEIKQFADRFQG